MKNVLQVPGDIWLNSTYNIWEHLNGGKMVNPKIRYLLKIIVMVAIVLFFYMSFRLSINGFVHIVGIVAQCVLLFGVVGYTYFGSDAKTGIAGMVLATFGAVSPYIREDSGITLIVVAIVTFGFVFNALNSELIFVDRE